jgi:glycosyltransferase involved in cell wall biosynthesis
VTKPTAAGVRRHVIDLVTGLHALGVRQGLVYSPEGADAAFWEGLERLQGMGVASFAVPMKREVDPRGDARAGRELARLVRRLRPRVLHLHSSKAGGIGRLAALAFPRVRVVYSPHASAANLAPVYGRIERFLGHVRTDRLVAVSASERDEIAALRYVPDRRLVRVDAGIDAADVEAGAAGPPPVPLPEGRLLVAAGRMNEQKNPELLVEASRELLARFADLHVVWIGDGENREGVERMLDEAGIRRRWTITGWVANPFPVIGRAAVFALPSRYESFGYVTLEAMVLGKPVVSTAVAGSRDLVAAGETGYLVPPGEPHAFAEAVARVLRDPAHAEALGRAAAERARHFSRERMAAEVLEVYRGLGL